MNSTTTTKPPASKRSRKFAHEPQSESRDAKKQSDVAPGRAETGQSPTKRQSKANLLVQMLERKEGATLFQMVAATGWLPNTTRAALTGLRKKGHQVTSTKTDGVRTYRVIESLAATNDSGSANSETVA